MANPPTPLNPPLLLGRDDPAPFVVLRENGRAPALIVCDHASRAIPRGLDRLGLPELPTWQHIAWDIGAGELSRGLSDALDAPAVLAGFRAHRTVPLIVSVHTFTPSMGGRDRPWHIGILWDKDEPNARRMLHGLSGIEDVVVGDNLPYSGKHPSDYTIDHHAERAGLPHVCIEVRQDQFESSAGTERWVRILSRLIGDLLGNPAARRLIHMESPAWRHASHR